MNLQEIQKKIQKVSKAHETINIIDIHESISRYNGLLDRLKVIRKEAHNNPELVAFLSMKSISLLETPSKETLHGLPDGKIKQAMVSTGLFFDKDLNKAYIDMTIFFCQEEDQKIDINQHVPRIEYRWYRNLRIVDKKGEIIDLSPKRS